VPAGPAGPAHAGLRLSPQRARAQGRWQTASTLWPSGPITKAA
jgi:hypothetical protein